MDEAGRGPLAGPVVAAAVTLPTNRFRCRIDDSKLLTGIQREAAYKEIAGKAAFGIGIVDERAIDRLNILVATKMAMQQAVFDLVRRFQQEDRRIYVLVDGNVLIDLKFPLSCIVRGDGRSKSIASASIMAKVTRDRIMVSYHKKFPQYGFMQHKGYPTRMHRDAIRKFGPSLIHRMSFLS